VIYSIIARVEVWKAGCRNKSGSLAMLTAMRWASSRVSSLPVARRPGSVLTIDEGECLPIGVAHDETRGGLLADHGSGKRRVVMQLLI